MAPRALAAVSLLGAGAADKIILSIVDCGEGLPGHVSDINPKLITTGKTTTVTGSGTVDNDVASGSYTLDIKALGVKLQACKGDLCAAASCALPLQTGSIDFSGLSCPVSAGAVDIPMDVTVSEKIPSQLAVLEIDLKSPGLLCAKINTKPGTTLADMERYQAWKARHGISYAQEEEDQRRAVIFQQNVDHIDKTNAMDLGYELEENKFTALTPDEFAAIYTGFKPTENLFGELPFLGEHEATDEIFAGRLDWREAGAVTPIKDQGACGSCWAFSAVGALEGAWQVSSGKLVSLSEQQLVNCAHGGGSIGCMGGQMWGGLAYAVNHDICTESEFAYRGWIGMGEIGSCSKKCTGIKKGGFTGYKKVTKNSMSALMSAVNLLPVSVGVNAGPFQSYKSGVLSKQCGPNTDHGVLVIGYGTDPSGGDYWLVKNSWGADWGEEGTIRVKRGVPGPGECGILTQAAYAVAKADVVV